MEDAEVLKELYETIKQNSKADCGIIEQRASYPYALSFVADPGESGELFCRLIRYAGSECNPECGAR